MDSNCEPLSTGISHPAGMAQERAEVQELQQLAASMRQEQAALAERVEHQRQALATHAGTVTRKEAGEWLAQSRRTELHNKLQWAEVWKGAQVPEHCRDGRVLLDRPRLMVAHGVVPAGQQCQQLHVQGACMLRSPVYAMHAPVMPDSAEGFGG
jgi:hypothetical protein